MAYNKRKKAGALVLAAALAMGLLTGCGSNADKATGSAGT